MEISTDINIESTTQLDLRPKDSRFKYELNLGLALPTKFRAGKGYDITQEHSSLVKSVNDDGSIAMIKIKTQSNTGPLSGFDNDVLTVLLTMAWEQKDYNQINKSDQNGYRVYYTHYEICRRLGLKEGSAGYVAEAIDNISSQNLTLNNFAYTTIDKKAVRKDEKTKIILKKGKITLADGKKDMDEFTSYFYIEFDNFVVKNLYNDYVSVLNSNKYLSLKTGPYRRVFVYLSSKRKLFGNRFIFDLAEISQVLGISESVPKKQRELVGKYLTSVSGELNSFKFTIDKQRGQNTWTILIQFLENADLIDHKCDPFYEAITKFYSTKKIESLKLQEIDFINMREEFENRFRSLTGSHETTFQKESINAAEFALDICLFQVLRRNYTVTKSFKALVKAVLNRIAEGIYELPDGYRYFIYKRNMSIDKKEEKLVLESEKQRQAVLKEEERLKLDKAFRHFYNDIVKKNKRQMAIYTDKAITLIKAEGIDEDHMAYKFMLDGKVEHLAKLDFDGGDVMNMAQKGGEMLLS